MASLDGYDNGEAVTALLILVIVQMIFCHYKFVFKRIYGLSINTEFPVFINVGIHTFMKTTFLAFMAEVLSGMDVAFKMAF